MPSAGHGANARQHRGGRSEGTFDRENPGRNGHRRESLPPDLPHRSHPRPRIEKEEVALQAKAKRLTAGALRSVGRPHHRRDRQEHQRDRHRHQRRGSLPPAAHDVRRPVHHAHLPPWTSPTPPTATATVWASWTSPPSGPSGNSASKRPTPTRSHRRCRRASKSPWSSKMTGWPSRRRSRPATLRTSERTTRPHQKHPRCPLTRDLAKPPHRSA